MDMLGSIADVVYTEYCVKIVEFVPNKLGSTCP